MLHLSSDSVKNDHKEVIFVLFPAGKYVRGHC